MTNDWRLFTGGCLLFVVRHPVTVEFLPKRLVLFIAHFPDGIGKSRMYASIAITPPTAAPPSPKGEPKEQPNGKEEQESTEEKEGQCIQRRARQDAYGYRF